VIPAFYIPKVTNISKGDKYLQTIEEVHLKISPKICKPDRQASRKGTVGMSLSLVN
jgi:hypothetical protein